MKGKWNKDFFKNENPIVLELGCGRGEYTVGLARRYADKNFIGVDIKGARMWTGATEALNEGLKNAAFLKGEYDTTFIDTRFDKEDLKRRQNTDPTVAVIAAAVRHYEREKEAASRATTLPVVGESLWKYYGKLQMTANNY
jgi:trans-aconitate methyltransferase